MSDDLADQEKLAAVREWAETGIMRRPWPLGDGTKVMLALRREVLAILDGHFPLAPIASMADLAGYIQRHYATERRSQSATHRE